ncbi:hypothetical protein [Actinocrinis sp.]|uniref:hypothetical protein n=1 Tax=Actinocrinis sp. TaxID=1920516 RepID=UPI002B54D44B|nr:hypothetical protein [Actinocrinis sp.]HXR71543.1 hypothetical protein [Actinocrinis sp.]
MRNNKTVRIAAVVAAASAAMCYASSASASSSEISGTVHDAQGHVVAGAHVQLNAFAMDRKGIHEITIASTTSNSSGHYSVPLPSTAETATLAKVDAGTINYEVDVTSASGGALQTAATTAPASAIASTDRNARVAAGLSSARDLDLTVKPAHLVAGGRTRTHVTPRGVAPCGFVSWDSTGVTGTYSVIIGEPHAYIGMSVQYTYQQNATTTIGIGYSNSGSNWSANGAASVTFTGGSSVMTAPSGDHYAPYMWGTFVYDKQQEYISCQGNVSNYRIVPDYWTGSATASGNLTQYDGSNSPVWQYDQSHGGVGEAFYDSNMTFSKSGGPGATYSAGVNVFGINLSANTNYSTSVTYKWVMNNNSSIPHVLFGNGVYPAATSGAQIVYSN